MLWIIFILFFLIIAILFLKLLLERKNQGIDLSDYQKKERTMNESEQALFMNLQKTLGAEYIVLAKVRIEDFVEIKKGAMSNEKWGLRGRIKSRHVDFLICDHATTQPLLAVELDGASHNDPKRQKRDHFINELYQAIQLPIKHIPIGKNFPQVANEIKEDLRKIC